MKNARIMFAICLIISCNKKQEKVNQLGVVDLHVFGSNTAQPHFKRGLLLLHSFEYTDAREEFLKAQEKDPEMGMAYWGEAMTYNHAIWGEQDYDEGLLALEKYKALNAKDKLSAVEQDFLNAVDILYKSKTPKADRDQDYMNYMKNLYNKYPENHEVAAFYAISLLGSVQEGRNDSIYGLGAKVAEKILKVNPEHPGALHYLIHSYDDPVHAKLALDAANAYSQVAPDASHALHMPSHIFVALGMWDRVVNSNIDSYQASLNRMERKSLDNNARGFHAYHWLEYGYLQQDSIEQAKQMVLKMQQYTDETPTKRIRAHMVFLKGTYLVETNDWDSPLANIEIDVSGLNLTIKSQYWFLEAYKAFVKSDAKKIDEIIDQFNSEIKKESLLVSNLNDGFTVCSSLSRDTPTQTNIDESTVMLTQIYALRDWSDNRIIETERWLKDAIDAGQKLSYSYGPPVIKKPTHELYADWLMSQERYEEAMKHYDLALKMGPNRKSARDGIEKSRILIQNEVTASAES